MSSDQFWVYTFSESRLQKKQFREPFIPNVQLFLVTRIVVCGKEQIPSLVNNCTLVMGVESIRDVMTNVLDYGRLVSEFELQ